jgi:hypothetical protein
MIEDLFLDPISSIRICNQGKLLCIYSFPPNFVLCSFFTMQNFRQLVFYKMREVNAAIRDTESFRSKLLLG